MFNDNVFCNVVSRFDYRRPIIRFVRFMKQLLSSNSWNSCWNANFRRSWIKCDSSGQLVLTFLIDYTYGIQITFICDTCVCFLFLTFYRGKSFDRLHFKTLFFIGLYFKRRWKCMIHDTNQKLKIQVCFAFTTFEDRQLHRHFKQLWHIMNIHEMHATLHCLWSAWHRF